MIPDRAKTMLLTIIAAVIVFIAAVSMTLPNNQRSINMTGFTLTSETFQEGDFLNIEQAYSMCGGQNISPELSWAGAPSGAKSFALVVHDPDAPVENGWYHWIVANIPLDKTNFQKGEQISFPLAPGRTSYGEMTYGGPCPPPGHGKHRYNFTIYALNIPAIALSPSPVETEKLIKSHSIGHASIMGYYERM
jgi:hypothetical protein